MASITATGAGSWSSTTPDAPWPSGTVPSAGDTVSAGAYAIDIDVTTIGSSGTPMAELTATSGYFTFGNNMTGACTVYATKMTAGISGGVSGTFRHTATSTGYNLTIYTGTGAGNGIKGGPTGSTNSVTVVKTSTKNLTIHGDVTGGDASGGNGVTISNATGTFAFSGGDIYGGSGSNTTGIDVHSNCTGTTITATNIIKGGSGASAHGIWMYSTGSIVITSPLIQGGIGAGAEGVHNSNSPTVTLDNATNFINGTSGSGGMAYGGRPPVSWTPGASNYWDFGSFKLAKEVESVYLIEGIANGSVTGTYHEATVAEVQDGVMFGPSSTLEGTYTGSGGGLLTHPGTNGGLNG